MVRPLLFAFLDDLYVVTEPDIARKAFDIVTGEVERIAGIRTNLGKLQLYCKAGDHCPPGFEVFFFRVHSALCLGSFQAGEKLRKLLFSAASW